jgi:hypothetical protein
MVAHLNVGCRVEGSYGPFLPNYCNPDGTQRKRRKRQQIKGTIVEARGEKKWLVKFDSGEFKECPSVELKMLGDPRFTSRSSSVVSETLASVVAPVVPSIQAPVAPSIQPPEASSSVLAPEPPSHPEPEASSSIVAPEALEASSSVVVPEVSTPAPEAEVTSSLVVPEDDPDLEETAEAVQEGALDEDAGFDVAKNITSDVYQQCRQECEAKKLELIESSWQVTCKSGSNQLVWSIIPDSIAEAPPVEYANIGVRDMD